MADCKVEKNAKNGKINKILDQSGNKSTLFQELLNVPTLSLNEAIEAYKNIYSEQLKDTIKYQIIGEKGTQNLDKIEEATFRMDNLKVAREMNDSLGLTDNDWQTKGAKQDEKKRVLLTTGWQKGADLAWKYEILDGTFLEINFSKGREVKGLNNVYEYALSEVYANKDLYTAFPQILNSKVIFFKGGENRKGESMSTDGSTIYINTDYYDSRRDTKSNRFFTEDEQRASFLHELQHISQGFEGFQRGGNPKEYSTRISEYFDKLRGEADKGLTETESDKGFREFLQKSINDNSLIFVEKDIDKIVKDEKLSNIIATLSGIDMYNRLIGETEARSVESRINMSAEERRQTLLEETEDVAREDQIFLMDNLGGSQMSFSPQKGKITQEIIDKLKQNGLSEDVFLLSTEEIRVKLKQLKKDGLTDSMVEQVIAWHGTPYSFDKFTTEKMGTGEGVQAFGWGLYFTDLESIARNYAKTLYNKRKYEQPSIYDIFYKYAEDILKPNINYVKKIIEAYNFSESWRQDIENYMSKNSDVSNILKYVDNLGGVLISPKYATQLFDTKQSANSVDEFISSLEKENIFTEDSTKEMVDILKNLSAKKNLYKVSLHKGKTPSEYTWLEWDTQIAKEVKEKFSNIIKNENLKGEIHNIKLSDKYDVESFDGGKTWKVGDTTKIGTEEEFVATFKDKKEAEKEAYKLNFVESNITGKDLYEALAKQIGQKEASIFLLENGIDGIKYPAESIARGATSDNARGFNYVVFDENAITIEEQIQFSKSLNNVGINLITNGFTVKEYPTNSKILDILISKNVIEKVC